MSESMTASQFGRAVAKGRGVQPETLILRSVKQMLEAHGWWVVRIQQGLGAHKGIADLVAMKRGRTVWVEVKTASGKLSSHQDRFCESVLHAGGEYVVARCVGDVEHL